MKMPGVRINRTGIEASPIDKKQVIEGGTFMPPTTALDGSGLVAVLADYMKNGERIGSVPPPTSLKGAAKAVTAAMKGETPTLLLDKLGERIGFERTGSRLYETLIAKFDVLGGFDGGPTRPELVEIYDEERAHFALVCEAMRKLGGDPTALTPSADLHAVASSGIGKVLGDPRTTVGECLEAILVAEMTDESGWESLIQIAGPSLDEPTLKAFRDAQLREAEHVQKVRRWKAASLEQRITSKAS